MKHVNIGFGKKEESLYRADSNQRALIWVGGTNSGREVLVTH